MRILLSTTILLLLVQSVHAQSADSLIASDLIVPAKYKTLFDSAHTVLLPKGFVCRVFYARVGSSPRTLAIRPDGVVCMADNVNSVIYALPDMNHVGVADTAITLAYNDSNSHGFAFYNGALYTAAVDVVMKYEHPNKDGLYVDSSIFISGIPDTAEGSPNHTTRTILFDTVGKSIFLSVGAPCNACREKATERAAILRFDLDGTGRRIYASGLRNAVGLSMDNATHTLWASVSERNSQGADVPPDFATRIVDQGYYGWPFAYGDHQWEDFSATPEYHKLLPITHADSTLVASMQPWDMVFPAHTTPLGIAIYHSNTFPGYEGNFFITLHGSYPAAEGRIIANGSKIERAQFINGKWMVTDFASGFLTDSIGYKRWARPCGIVIDTAGDLYFTSDYTDPHTPPAVYRISYVGAKTVPQQAPVNARLISIYPDPVTGYCSVIANGVGSNPWLNITDILGRVVREESRVSSNVREAQFTLNLRDLPNGMYVVRLSGGAGVVERKFVIQH